MGDNRKNDVRIYIIFVVFFICSITGGILLCLYIFLPSANSDSGSWFAILGLVLVAIPWIVWFVIYMYQCFKPITLIDAGGKFRESINHDNNNNQPSSDTPKSPAAPCEAVARPSVSSYEYLTPHSQNNSGGGGERHVHFGAVMVMENVSSHGSISSHDQIHHHKATGEEFFEGLEGKELEDVMSETERPLTSVTRS
ncbi:hypothetical protein QN277_022947 [Acacia crassicarpa]|uniref:Membrane lipoprotein n=1 Tax=Acacia crassicarpa TaxID=499986 RepID=A0AAE1KCD0_9FABA|nr:hypothetical protein QN277_022947 [Acacia crassicarpa]